MKVLVACEESQRVCIAFREKGHETYSCDIIECSGGHPEWHIRQDVLPLLNGNCSFRTMDGTEHQVVGEWDMIIAFPPCTYLTVAGNRWFNVDKYGQEAVRRLIERTKAVAFFMAIAASRCERIAIENPVGVISTLWRKPDQITSPNEFGDKARKHTCFWLKNLNPLEPTEVVSPGEIMGKGYSVGASANWAVDEATGKILRWNDPRTAKIRSKTYEGISRAMAEQWGGSR